MDQMADALERAGFPRGLLAFASAAYDLARLALNQSPNPRRAAHAWLGMASGRAFRDGPLTDFMALVARQQEAAASAAGRDQNTAATRSPPVSPAAEPRSVPRPASSAGPAPAGGEGQLDPGTQINGAPSPAGTASGGAGGQMTVDTQHDGASPPSGTPSAGAEGQVKGATHTPHAPAPADPPSTGGAGHSSSDTQRHAAPPPAGTEHEGGGHETSATPTAAAPAPVYREPTREQIAAVRRSKELSARVMSGVYVTDSLGDRRMVDELSIAGLNSRLAAKGRSVAQGAIEYNTLYLVQRECTKPAFKPDNAVVGDILDAPRIRHLHDMARAFVGSPMVQMPEALRAVTEGPHAP